MDDVKRAQPLSRDAISELRREYDDELAGVRADLIRLAALAGESIAMGTEALLDADLRLVDGVIANDARLNALHRSIELRAYRLLALQQPMAHDLRTLLAVLRILHELELTGNLMVNVAKSARRLYPQDLAPRVRGIVERMGKQAGVQLQLALDAFVDQSAAVADALPDLDDVMDDLQKELFRAIFDEGATNEGALQRAVTIALVGRFYERVADHSVQIARWVGFMITGDLPSSEPPETNVDPPGPLS